MTGFRWGQPFFGTLWPRASETRSASKYLPALALLTADQPDLGMCARSGSRIAIELQQLMKLRQTHRSTDGEWVSRRQIRHCTGRLNLVCSPSDG